MAWEGQQAVREEQAFSRLQGKPEKALRWRSCESESLLACSRRRSCERSFLQLQQWVKEAFPCPPNTEPSSEFSTGGDELCELH
eukprot:s1392_g7.t1